MSRTWTTSSDGDNIGKPWTLSQRIVFALAFIVFVAALTVPPSTWAPEREVWWTVVCPTPTDPHRVCLDGTVSLDRIPEWAGGTASR